MTRPRLLSDHRAETIIGAALMLAGALCLRDAYEGRGRSQPFFLRPFTFL